MRYRYPHAINPESRLVQTICGENGLNRASDPASVAQAIGRHLSYTPRGGVEQDHGLMAREGRANCFGMAAIFGSLATRLYGHLCHDDCGHPGFLMGLRKGSGVIGVHAWGYLPDWTTAGRLSLYDPSDGNLLSKAPDRWLDIIQPAALTTSAGTLFDPHQVKAALHKCQSWAA